MRWMYYLSLTAVSAAVVTATLNLRQIRPQLAELMASPVEYVDVSRLARRQNAAAAAPKFLTDRTRKFVVNGTSIPEVNFDVGESYAGLLPISADANDPNQLYFWFFPSSNPSAEKEILIWLTGGPGCSSTGELMQENGPFLWTPGGFKPVENQWSWHRLTNVVWIDQPVGAGFSRGTPTARNEADVASQLMGFWRNFVDAFALQGFKVYITGSSYSGMYCPYVASAMLDANDKTYFDVSGMMVFDGLFSNPGLSQDLPVAAMVEAWPRVFAFNDSFSAQLREMSSRCGFADYLAKYLVYPPAGVQPSQLPGQNANGSALAGCDALIAVFSGAQELNPCFSVYDVFDGCQLPLDPLGFSAGTNFIPESFGPAYLNREDVKRAINAPLDGDWVFCAEQPVFVDGIDESVLAGPGSQPVLPNVIDKTQNVLIGHGARDFVLIAEGTLLAIQNISWGGQRGFQTRPQTPLFVPYHQNNDIESLAGAGVAGTTHSERGLTYFGVASSGHFLTQDQPAVSYRALEVLLGRVDGLGAVVPFTTDVNATAQPQGDMGAGTVFAGVEGSVGGAIGGGVESLGRTGDAQAVEASTAGASRTFGSVGIIVLAAVSAVVMSM